MITHPEKFLFPEDGIRKADLAAYYAMVAPAMLPHVAGRPITMERYPAGIGSRGFMHKSVTRGFPAWLQRITVPKKGGAVHHAVVTDERSLLWLVNQNCITLHVSAARASDLAHPDVCVFDLDPSTADPGPLRAAALALRAVFDELGLPGFVKTSGSKGFHAVVPLDGRADFAASAGFAARVGALLVARHPDLVTREFLKADRGARVLIDTGRNAPAATHAAVYSVRAKPGAPVSAPCTWDEVASGDVGPRTFTLANLEQRLAAVGDLWAEVHAVAVALDDADARVRRMLEDTPR